MTTLQGSSLRCLETFSERDLKCIQLSSIYFQMGLSSWDHVNFKAHLDGVSVLILYQSHRPIMFSLFFFPFHRSRFPGVTLFVRVEVLLKGATYHILVTDTNQLPPPFRIDNKSEVTIFLLSSCHDIRYLHISPPKPVKLLSH